MKNTQNLSRNSQVLLSLSALPEKILALHGTENLSEFVLYELCHQNCFDIPKAAFFSGNPDVNCFKGVAGYNRAEHQQQASLWDDPDHFTDFMKENSFNKKVRSVNQCAVQGGCKKAHDYLDDIAHQLDVRELGYHRFPVKHGNHGVLVYDKQDTHLEDMQIFARGACFLGFCPIF